MIVIVWYSAWQSEGAFLNGDGVYKMVETFAETALLNDRSDFAVFSVALATDVAMGRRLLGLMGAGENSKVVVSELTTNAIGKPASLIDAALVEEMAALEELGAQIDPNPTDLPTSRLAEEKSEGRGCLVIADVYREAGITAMKITSGLNNTELGRLRRALTEARKFKMGVSTRHDRRDRRASRHSGRGLEMVVCLSHSVTSRALRDEAKNVVGVVMEVIVFDSLPTPQRIAPQLEHVSPVQLQRVA